MHRQYVHEGSRAIAYLDSSPQERELPVLVLIHAFPLGAGMWEAQVKTPTPGWRVIAPELRGFSGSTLPTPDEPAAIDDYADDVLAVMSELGIAKAVIAGCSLGGYVALAMLRRAPEVVRALVLIDTRAGADTSEGRAKRRGMLALLEREGPAGVAKDMVPTLLGQTTHDTNTELEHVVRRLITQQSSDAIRGAIMRMMERPDSTALLAQVQVPALVMFGAEDALIPADEARKLAGGITGARLVEIPKAGHLPSLEQPLPFNAALSGFLVEL